MQTNEVDHPTNAAGHLVLPLIISRMARKKREHEITVELTAYGWSVSEDGVQIGLFVNKDAAMNRVRIRAQALKKLGELWSLRVIGVEPPKGSRSFPTRR